MMFLLSQPFFMPPSTISALIGLGRLHASPSFRLSPPCKSLPLHPIVSSSAVVNHTTTFDDLRLRCLGCAAVLTKKWKLLPGEEKNPHSVTMKRLWEEGSKSSPK